MQDRKILASLVRKQLDAGAQALAVNLGPGREMGRLTPWVVDTIREVTDMRLFFSANIIAQKQVLQMHGQHIAINAVTANQNDLVRALATAQEYGSSLVVLLVQSGRVPAGIDDRIQLAGEVLEQAVLSGLPLSRLYLDPVLTCRPDPAAWHVSRGLPDVGSAVETIGLIHQLDSRVKTIVALGNGTEGMAREKRSGLHGRMLSLFAEAGLDGVLLNCFDSRVMRTAEGIQSRRPLFHGADTVMGQMCSMA
jgi:5-methyltetrahydrofolate corrinoid/iron sulfur protein methyltransferase